MIILMGLAGSGKSTQGQRLAEETGRVWLSTGQILRDIADEDMQASLAQGNLAADEVVIPLVEAELGRLFAQGKDVVLDGFPRTVTQVDWLVQQMADRIETVIQIEVPKAELIERMKRRGRADDQSIVAIEERFRLVEQSIQTVCAILQKSGIKIKMVDGVGTVETVQSRLEQALIEAKNE